MINFSILSKEIKPTLTRKLFNIAKQYDDVIDFTLGDPDIPTPQPIKEAGCKAIMEGKTRYSQNAGLLELRTAISNHYKNIGLEYNPSEEIIVTVGAMEGLYLSLLAILNEGDEVVIPAPYYVNYAQMVKLCHGTPVIVENTHNKLECSIEGIKAAITDRTKAIILNSPCNPTGKVISQNALREISFLAEEHDLLIITDEVYKCLIYNYSEQYRSIASFPNMKERTIIVNSFSKEFCMTGWRVGYVLAPKEIVSIMTVFQENIAACAPLPSQYAAIEAFRPNTDYTSEIVSLFKKRRDLLMKELKNVKNISIDLPEATFYAMIDISKSGMKSEEFAYALLEQEHVAVVPGITYGLMCDDYVRLAFTLNEGKIIEGISRLKHFMDNI